MRPATPPSPAPGLSKTYEVRFVPDPKVRADGLLDASFWARAEPLGDFHFPWTARSAPATEFRALCDGRRLFFVYTVADDDLVLVDPFLSKMDVIGEDRVEIFFACDPALRRYFGLEIDPLGRTLDYAAAHYRRFDRSWTCPGLQTAGRRTASGYVVEAAIPLAMLESLGAGRLDASEGILAGLFRAEFRHGPDGATVEDWISWVDPCTEKPDFHVPAAFGRLRLARPEAKSGLP